MAFGIASFYASFFRGTPLLYGFSLDLLGLPQLGVIPGAIAAGIIALAELRRLPERNFRAGIVGVPMASGKHHWPWACAET